MTFTPYNFQLTDLATLRDNNYTGLLAVEMGGGKTVSSLLAVKDSGASSTLVIAPKSTHKSAWAEDAEKVLGQPVRVIDNNTKANRQALSDFEWGYPGIYAVTPQLFTRADISMWKPDMLIADEVHVLGNPGKSGQRKLSGFSPKDSPISRQSGMRLALSGTPARNNFERMWSVMRFLWPELNQRGQVAYDNFHAWCHQRMTSEDVFAGRKPDGSIRTVKNWLQEIQPGRLFSEAPCVVQHFRRETCCWEPEHQGGFLKHDEPNVSRRVVDISAKQNRIIKELERQGLAWLDDNPMVAELPITLQQRIRQVCLGVPTLTNNGMFDDYGVEKVDVGFEWNTESAFADEVEDILEKWDGETVVIYMSSQKFAAALTERLKRKGEKVFEFSGATANTRMGDLQRFGTDYRIMVATIESVGTGTNGIQRVCSNEIWLERSVDETLNAQAEARTDRLGARGQTQRVIIEDSLGYAAGRFSEQTEKRLQLARSTRVAV